MTDEQLRQLLGVADKVGGAVWEAAVRGAVIGGIVDIVVGVVGLALFVLLTRRIAYYWQSMDVADYRSKEREDALTRILWYTVFTPVPLLMAFVLPRGIRAVAAPSWYAIKALIGVV